MKTKKELIACYYNGHWNATNPKVSKKQLMADAKEYANRMLGGAAQCS